MLVDSFKVKKILFHRDYQRFQGGHLKVWHYFNHLKKVEEWQPSIYFTANSVFDNTNPWYNESRLLEWTPLNADSLFLAGLDWLSMPEEYRSGSSSVYRHLPIVNLIQGLSHANKHDIKYDFLKNKAIRICVSKEVEYALTETKMVNGPIFTIENGIDIDQIPRKKDVSEKDIDFLILGLKNPELAYLIEKNITHSFENVVCLSTLIPRDSFLDYLNRAKCALFLPLPLEGFYLPALEAMALGTLVVCPDCIGNRSFCIDRQTCFLPTYDTTAILSVIQQLKFLDNYQRDRLLANAFKQVELHHLKRESEQFLAIMSNLSAIW